MKRSALLTTMLGALLVFAPAAEAQPKKRCKLKAGEVVAKNSRAIVWQREAGEGAAFEHELWGCLRKNGRRLRIKVLSTTTAGGSSYGQILLRGTHVAFSANGSGNNGECNAQVGVYSIAKRAYTRLFSEDSQEPNCVSVERLVLGRRGRTAFTLARAGSGAVRLYKGDATGQDLVDSGAVDSDSVAITGPNFDWRLSWTNGGAARSLRVW